MAEGALATRGRKVVFLYPHSVIADQLVQVLVHQEYEVYLVRDHAKLLPVLERPEFRNALLFVNIDEELTEPDWQAYARKIRESSATHDVHIGILSYNEDAALAATYLMDIGVQGGFIHLKLGLAESTRIVLASLAATEARGQRKYVRADCTGIIGASLNAKFKGALHSGRLRDVSSAGIACVFDGDPGIGPGATLPDIQLKLRGSVAMVGGSVAGMREVNSERIYVIMFNQPCPDPVKERLYRFIYDCLQSWMARLLETSGRA